MMLTKVLTILLALDVLLLPRWPMMVSFLTPQQMGG